MNCIRKHNANWRCHVRAHVLACSFTYCCCGCTDWCRAYQRSSTWTLSWLSDHQFRFFLTPLTHRDADADSTTILLNTQRDDTHKFPFTTPCLVIITRPTIHGAPFNLKQIYRKTVYFRIHRFPQKLLNGEIQWY